MTITPHPSLNIAACEIQGNKLNGRIVLVTNSNTQISTLCRVDATDEGSYPTDSVNPFIQQRVGMPVINIMPAGEDSTGWELVTADLLQPNMTYEFNYHVEVF